VPTDEDEGAGGDVHYVTVEQDPDKSLEVCVSACADEGKPPVYSLTKCSLNLWIIIAILCAFTFRICIETLVAWTLSTYDLLLAY
jgi:hypothetical protein